MGGLPRLRPGPAGRAVAAKSIRLCMNETSEHPPRQDWAARLIGRVAASPLPAILMLVAVAVAGGVVALAVTSREEEPQTVVPVAGVFVDAPGALLRGRGPRGLAGQDRQPDQLPPPPAHRAGRDDPRARNWMSSS